MNKTPKLVIFDLDGTLIEFCHSYLYDQTNNLLSVLGLGTVSTSVLEESFSAFDYFRFLPQLERNIFIKEFWDKFDWENFPQPKPLNGAKETLKLLVEHGLDVAIATSRFVKRNQLALELEATGFLDFVSALVSRTSQETHWTDKTGLILEVCEELGRSPEEAVMVGDSPTDILSAKEARVGFTVAVLSGGIREDILATSHPDIILPDISHLANVISSNHSK